MIRRGEIYWVRLDPTFGAEIKKTRPALVISNDQNNEFADTVTVLPVTSQTKKIFPFDVFIPKGVGGLKEEGKIKTNQIRTVDKRRLVASPLGPSIGPSLMREVEKALCVHLGIKRSVHS